MTKTTLTMAISAALLLPTMAFAQVQVVNGEAGMIFRDAAREVADKIIAKLKQERSLCAIAV
jgi:hypothetical protein